MHTKISIIALLLMPVSLMGQVIDPTVEVSREFDVKLMEIRKPDIPVNIADSLQKFDIHFDYSIFNRPYKDLYEFSPYQLAQIKPVEAPKNPFFYAKLGVQYPLMPSAELYLQTVSKNGFYAALYGQHNSFWGTMPSTQQDGGGIGSKRMNNLFGGNLKYAWMTGELLFDINYHLDKYDFERDIKSIFHDNNQLNLSFRAKSAHNQDNSLYYDFGIAYRNSVKKEELLYSGSQPLTGHDTLGVRSLTENYLHIDGSVGTTFDVHRVYINMGIEYASYSGVKSHTAGVVEFSPLYEYKKGNIFAKIGAKFSSRYGIVPDTESASDVDHQSVASNIFPDVDAKWEVVKNSLWLHAIVTGGNDIHAYSSLMNDCPYIDPQSQLKFESHVVDARIAVESVIKGRVGLNVFASYCVGRNVMVFTPVMSGYDPETLVLNGVQSTEPYSITTSYWDVNTFSVGIEPFWKSKDLTLGGNLRYNCYKSPDDYDMTNLPAWQGRAYLRYNWRERIVAGVEWKYTSGVSGSLYGDYSVPAIMDLDINLNFIWNSHFSLFLKGGNLLNRRNQYVPLFIEPSINFGGGICVNF